MTKGVFFWTEAFSSAISAPSLPAGTAVNGSPSPLISWVARSLQSAGYSTKRPLGNVSAVLKIWAQPRKASQAGRPGHCSSTNFG